MSDMSAPLPGAQFIQDNNEHKPRSTRTGELAVSQAHGKYLEAGRTANLWMISTPVAGIVATANMLFSVASSNAILGLYNNTSDTYMHVVKTVLTTATSSACNLVWAINTPTTYAVVPAGTSGRNLSTFGLGGHKAVAFNGAQAVSGGAVTQYFRTITSIFPAGGRFHYAEDDGDIVIPPLGFAGVYADAAVTTQILYGYLVWEEVKK